MKLDLILENIRNKYNLEMLEMLEESSSLGLSEKDTLEGKILINESTMFIRSMLVDQGILEETKQLMHQLFQEALVQEVKMPVPNQQVINKINNTLKAPGPIGEPSTATEAINRTKKDIYLKQVAKNLVPNRRTQKRTV